ncbi:long-chain-fatty-acid--CoA ligase [Xylanimonas ulmi]|uniref:Fatty-acyl-CoA synthase n=1 Tax=Xylanimonas ulmi TaxID=228973 RepID=A0A4Q7M287_9MICO|nr:long-chain-fatty-acid--CoA ligase [Xylanibacterium ulmi]RZS61564.1 fatty-acyl-CoA synthase [Xylanibacterium ulmi]
MTAHVDLSSEPYASRRAHWNNTLARHAHTLAARPALRFEGQTTTWAQLHERVGALADALARRGVSFGDRVALVMGNRPQFLEAILAINRLGAIAVPLNFRLAAGEVAFAVADSGAAVVFVDAIGRAAVVGADLPERVRLVVVAADPGAGESYDALLEERGEPCPAIDVPEDSPALIMYTSGTTGRPKGAVLTHLNLQAQAGTVTRAMRLGDADQEVNLIALPLFHIGALGSVVGTILIGGAVVIMPTAPFRAAALLDVLESEGVTAVFLVPTQWQAVCADPTVADRDLSRLRMACWGAAPASDALLRQMAATFPDARNVALFGQTEMSPVTCVLDGADAIRKLGSVGKPVATVTARVVDAEMNDVEQGQVGEIVYRGPGLMAEYWNMPEATSEAFAGGWFHSGDLVRVDEEGYFYVVDRVKDMIISGGENIYCAEVENALSNHPQIAEVSVVGVPHPVWGETPVAYVALRDPNEPLDLESLREWATSSLARYKLPTRLELITELPRNASGKVRKDVLRETAEAS